MPPLYSDNQPGWRHFEDFVSQAIRDILDTPRVSKLLKNRHLGARWSPEADLLFPIKLNGKDSVILVECKKREVWIEQGEVHTRHISGSKQLPQQLAEQVYAAERLQLHSPRVLVVGFGEKDYMRILSPNLVVVQLSYFDEECDFCPETLKQGWSQISAGAEQLTTSSDLHKKLCALPRKVRKPYNS